MKQTAPAKADTPARRKARFDKVVAKARAEGETLPRRLDLVAFRNLTAKEREHGKTLGPLARKCLQKSARVAA